MIEYYMLGYEGQRLYVVRLSKHVTRHLYTGTPPELASEVSPAARIYHPL